MKILPVLTLTTLALGACTESGKLRLDSQVSQTTAALTMTQGSSSLELQDGLLIIESARISVSEIEIEGGEEDNEERESDLGPAVIDLNLDGAPTQIAASSVEAGAYDTIGFELARRKFPEGSASIIVTGSYDGSPFVYTTGWTAEVEFRLDPEVVVPANGEATVGVTFDVASWLVAEDGTATDPTDEANQGAIRERIIASITAEAIEVELEGEDD